MPRVLDDHVPSSSGTAKKYNWDELLDGLSRLMIKDQDYTCQVGSLRMMANKQAQTKGIKVRIERYNQEGEEGVIVTAYKETVGDMNPHGGKKSRKAQSA